MSTNNRTSILLLVLITVMSFFPVVSAVNTTQTETSPLSIIPQSSTIEVGDPLVIDGFIDDSIFGPYPGTAIVIIRAPMSSLVDSYTTLTPNQDGTFTYSVDTDVTGTWKISGRYGDEISAVSEVKVTPRETVKRAVNTLNSYTVPVFRGEGVTLTGYLRDSAGVGLANKEVKYMVALPPYGCSICDYEDLLIWHSYEPVTTDTTGRYSISFIPYDQGEYRVKTIYPGDETYQGSESKTRKIKAG